MNRLMCWFRGLMCLAAACACVSPAHAQRDGSTRFISLDGRFGDWRNTELLVADPIDAPDDAVVDFGAISVHDTSFAVYLLLDLGKEVNIQAMDGSVEFYLDVDGSEETGAATGPLPGADLHIICSRRFPDATRGSGLAATWLGAEEREASIADIGFEAAPTFASSRFELRLNRGDIAGAPVPCFISTNWRGRLQALSHDGSIVDETDVFRHELRTAFEPWRPVMPDFDPNRRSRRAGARIMSWNVQYGSILKDHQRFIRILKAINPDVILFQELMHDDSPQRLARILSAACPTDRPGGWNVVIAPAGGNLRCAIASRWDIERLPDFENIPERDDPDRTMRHCTAVVQLGTRRLLASSLHFQCCGSAGTVEDRKRNQEAGVMHESLIEAYRKGGANCAVVAGDLNLVGSVQPLHTLIGRQQGPGTVLNVVDPKRLHGRSMSTWSDRHQPFPPGRLDYMTYAGAHFGVARAFVFDTADVSDAWLEKHGLERGDCEAACDHRPIVADVYWE